MFTPKIAILRQTIVNTVRSAASTSCSPTTDCRKGSPSWKAGQIIGLSISGGCIDYGAFDGWRLAIWKRPGAIFLLVWPDPLHGSFRRQRPTFDLQKFGRSNASYICLARFDRAYVVGSSNVGTLPLFRLLFNSAVGMICVADLTIQDWTSTSETANTKRDDLHGTGAAD
jgi:hypothetical protein